MNFGHPTSLWWLAAVPVLVLFLVWAYRARRRALAQFAAEPLADRLALGVRPVARRWKAVLLVAGILFAVLAWAQPRWGFEWRQVKRKGVDIFALLDVSRSMLTEDVRPNRLTQAKFAVEDLLTKLQGDRVGLVAFAGTAFVQCPLTVDYDAFRLTLREAGPKLIPRGGTAIGVALRTALKGFEAGKGRDRAVVLITDGEETEGEALPAAEELAQAGVRIFAIGVGTVDGELIPLRDDNKTMEFLKDKEGQVVKSRLDEETLKQLALKTQGIYVRSAAGDFGMETVYENGIAQLKRKDYEEQLQKRYFECFQWPLGIAVALLVLEMFVSDRKRVAIVVAALWLSAGNSRAADKSPAIYNDGVRAYRTNDLPVAARTFEQATASRDRALQERAFYNIGNTAYRQGEVDQTKAESLWQRAIKDYESAMALDPKDEDAKFNRAFVTKKLEELKKQQEQQKQQQQQHNKQDQQKQDQSQNQQQQQQAGQDQKQQEQPKPQQSQPQDQSQQQQEAKAEPGKDNLDKQQAAAMLDNLREEERNWNFFPEVQMKDLKDRGAPEKDW